MKTNIEHRVDCRICGSKNVECFLHLGGMPFTDEFVSNDSLGEEFIADIDVYACRDCLVIQTQHNVDVTDYYDDYQYSVGNSKFAMAFMSDLANVVVSNYLKQVPTPKILEIGSGDGEQLSFFKNLQCEVLGYEPSLHLSNLAIKKGIPTIQGLFNKNSLEKLPESFKKVNVVLLSYTFDHIPEPVELLKVVSNILADKNGFLIIEVHDIDKIFERSEFCLFEHEHSIYLNADTAKFLLNKEGFEIISFELLPEESRRANSLLFIATKSDTLVKENNNYKADFLLNSFRFYQQQAAVISERIKNFELFIKRKIEKGQTIAGYGAGGRGVMTLAAINNAEKLKYLVDKNPKGCDIFTPKSHLPVFGIDKLKKEPVDHVIVFSFGYMKEIKEDLQQMGYSVNQIHSMVDILTGKIL